MEVPRLALQHLVVPSLATIDRALAAGSLLDNDHSRSRRDECVTRVSVKHLHHSDRCLLANASRQADH